MIQSENNDRPSQNQAVRVLATVLLLALLLLLFGSIIRYFLKPFIWASVIVVMTWPASLWIQRVTKTSRGITSLLMTVLIASALVLAVVPLTIQLAQEATSVLNAQQLVTFDQAVERVRQIPTIGGQAAEGLLNLKTRLSESDLSGLGQGALKIFTSGVKGLGQTIAEICLAIFFSFFLYRDGAAFRYQLKSIALALGGRQGLALAETTRLTLRAIVYGTVLTAICQGLLAGVGYWLFGVPFPILLGALTMIASFIPFGAPMIYLPIAAYLGGIEGAWDRAIFLAAWGLVLVSSVDNILRPLVISQATNLSLPAVLVGVLGGIMSFGLTGLILGPLTMALVAAVWRSYVGPASVEA